MLAIAGLASGCAAKSKKVKVVERQEQSFSNEGGLGVAAVKTRAWLEDIERDATSATLVYRAAEGQTIETLSIGPNSDVITFSLYEKLKSDRGDGGGFSGEQWCSTLRSVSTAGGGVSQLTTGRWLDLSPTYGPPGFITFNSNRTRPDGSDLFRIAADRAGGVSVIRQTSDGYSMETSVAANGMSAFTYKPDYRGRGVALDQTREQIWTVGGPTSYPTQLREGREPAFSPDGMKIAFIGENGQLWTMDAGGGNQIQLTSSAIPEDKVARGSIKMRKRSPSWTPDGKNILFAAADGKDSEKFSNYDIWMISKDGGDPRQLTTNGSYDVAPHAAPDGKWIYFVSNRGTLDGIWRIPMPR